MYTRMRNSGNASLGSATKQLDQSIHFVADQANKTADAFLQDKLELRIVSSRARVKV